LDGIILALALVAAFSLAARTLAAELREVSKAEPRTFRNRRRNAPDY
jgi:hypothetical protein